MATVLREEAEPTTGPRSAEGRRSTDHETLQEDAEEAGASDPTEIDTRNYAEDEPTNARGLTFLQNLTPHCRSDRSAFDSDARQLYNLWAATRDIHFYEGRAQVYIPACHKSIERACAKQYARLFPAGDDYFDVETLPPGQEEQEEIAQDLESAKALMAYDLQACVKLKRWVLSFLRQFNILGTSVSALDYVTAEEAQAMAGRTQYRLARQPEQPGKPLIGQPMKDLSEVGPTGRPVDLFTWYIWPVTINTLADAEVVFEDRLVSRATLKKWRKAGRYAFTDGDLAAHAGRSPQYSIWSSTYRMQERGVNPSDPDNDLFVVTTAYAKFALRGDPKTDEETEEIPCQFTMVNDGLLIELRQNQKWHQQPPYQVARMNTYVDEFYGRGLVYFTRSLQYLINDVTNQTLDGLAYVLNPIAAVDPDFADPDLLQYRPGAKWPIDKNKLMFLQIPDHSVQGFGAVRQLYEFSQDVAGASTGGMYLPTMGVARGADTATGQSLLIAQGDIDVNLIVADLEGDWLQPMLQQIDSLEQQFLPIQGDRILRALGPQALPMLQHGMRVRRETMLGTRIYHWTGNNTSEQREQFQKHGPDMLKILAQLKQANDPDYRINLAPFVKDLYRSFSFPNADDIIEITEQGNGFEPALEHAVMAAGWPIEPRWGEEYIAHMTQHDAALPMARAQGWGDRLEKHMFQTLALVQKAGAAAMPPGGMPTAGAPGGPGMPGGAPIPPANGPGPAPPPGVIARPPMVRPGAPGPGGPYGGPVPPPGGVIPRPGWPGGV